MIDTHLVYKKNMKVIKRSQLHVEKHGKCERKNWQKVRIGNLKFTGCINVYLTSQSCG